MKRINLIGPAFRIATLLGPSTRALSPRGIRVALLAAVVLVGMAFWSTAAYADGEEAGEPVWSADMTVVEYSSVSKGAVSADLFSNIGGSGNLQIKSLWSHVPGRDLRLAFQEDVPHASEYTLQVGGLSLEFPAGSSGYSSFKWNDVDVDCEDGQLIHVRIVLTAEIVAPQANTPATGVPTIRGTAQVGETLTADISGIADEDGLDSVSYRYQWMRTDADIADATDSTYTLTDDDQGKTIKLKVSFIDDNGNSETLTSAAREEVSKRPEFLVSNLGVGVEGASGIQRTLNAARSGFAQAFTTGAKTNGYVVGSVDIQMSQFFDASNTADQLRVTINGVASEGEPGDAHCTLTNPSSFTALSVITFEAPTGAGTCPQLAAETTYFVVIEWISPTGTDSFAVIPQTYPTKESAATAEDPGGAEGWSIANHSYYLSVSSDVRTWTAYDDTASFKIKVEQGAVTAAKVNSQATGAPTIGGTPQVGQTLTADTSAIDDEDGLDNVDYSYQWIADVTDISGATSSTYELTSSEQGKTIQVEMSFTDDAENEETLTSVATEPVEAKPNTAPTGLPTISGTPQAGQTLMADTTSIADEDGLENVSYEYQWIADVTDISGATSSTYELTSGEQGKTIQVEVSFTDDAENEEALTSVATEPVEAKPNTAPTGLPTIGGTPQAGQTLTANTTGISDADGLDNVDYSYQWIRNDGITDTDIETATDAAYTLTDDEAGNTIKARVTFTDDADNEETLTSAPTVEVQQGSNAWSATMTVETRDGYTGYSYWGDPQLGALSATEVEWDGKTHHVKYLLLKDSDLWLGLNEEMFSTGFVLSVGDEEFGSADARVDKSGASYRFLWDDRGLGWSVGQEVSVNLVESEQNTPALGPPTITGTPQVGETLTADTSGVEDADGLDNVSHSYQWMAGGTDIAGATGPAHTLTAAEEGKTISVRVTFADDADNEETLTSAATDAVAAAANNLATGLPSISGTPQVGETLTADISDITDQDGLTNVSYRYQWMAGGSDIAGATGSSYTLTSAAADAVAADPAPVPLTVRLKVAAPATHDGSSGFTFEIEFSEEFGLSYVTLRDFAFTETGGEVRKAQRMDKPSNIRWLITVEPQGNGDVTIVLPVTTDCNADGAVCTGDGRKLSLHRIRSGELGLVGGQRLAFQATRKPRISGSGDGSGHPESDGLAVLPDKDSRNVSTAHTVQEKARRLTTAAGVVQARVRPVMGGDRPSSRRRSRHRKALVAARSAAQLSASEGAL